MGLILTSYQVVCRSWIYKYLMNFKKKTSKLRKEYLLLVRSLYDYAFKTVNGK